MKGSCRMNRLRDYWKVLFISISFILISLTLLLIPEKTSDNNSDDTQTTYWGVDSAEAAQDELYECVSENFGTPDVFGRYIGDREDISVGLTEDEVSFLHEKEVDILLIYNHVTDATTEDAGAKHAEKAIELAQELDVPNDVALFVDIEPDFDVDADFIQGWYETIEASDYEPGIYGVFSDENELFKSFNDTEEKTQKNTILWTAYPQKEITSKEKAPSFDPQGPEDAQIYGWQYGIDAEKCTIDTNLFTDDMIDVLWKSS